MREIPLRETRSRRHAPGTGLADRGTRSHGKLGGYGTSGAAAASPQEHEASVDPARPRPEAFDRLAGVLPAVTRGRRFTELRLVLLLMTAV